MKWKIFKGWNTGGMPIFEWICDCQECRECASPCLAIVNLNLKEMVCLSKEESYSELPIIQEFATKLIENIEYINPKYAKLANKYFWDLI